MLKAHPVLRINLDNVLAVKLRFIPPRFAKPCWDHDRPGEGATTANRSAQCLSSFQTDAAIATPRS